MNTADEITLDLENLISKLERLSKNNDIWKELTSDLNIILIKLKKDRKMYRY